MSVKVRVCNFRRVTRAFGISLSNWKRLMSSERNILKVNHMRQKDMKQIVIVVIYDSLIDVRLQSLFPSLFHILQRIKWLLLLYDCLVQDDCLAKKSSCSSSNQTLGFVTEYYASHNLVFRVVMTRHYDRHTLFLVTFLSEDPKVPEYTLKFVWVFWLWFLFMKHEKLPLRVATWKDLSENLPISEGDVKSASFYLLLSGTF